MHVIGKLWHFVVSLGTVEYRKHTTLKHRLNTLPLPIHNKQATGEGTCTRMTICWSNYNSYTMSACTAWLALGSAKKLQHSNTRDTCVHAHAHTHTHTHTAFCLRLKTQQRTVMQHILLFRHVLGPVHYCFPPLRRRSAFFPCS